MRLASLRGFILVAVAVMCAVGLNGCKLRGRKVEAVPPPPFQSPITAAVGRPGMTMPEISDALNRRRSDTRALRGSLSISVGHEKSRTRQQFDANIYSAPPQFLRVRGSADAGAIFDYLQDRDAVKVLVIPEKKAYVGTLGQMRSNNNLMAGLQPDDLMNCFYVEQRLSRWLKENPATMVTESTDHFEITLDYAGGMSEKYFLRKTDLLVDQVTRSQAGRDAGSVRYFGYNFYGKSLLPNFFEATLPNGGVARVQATDLQPNSPRNKELNQLTIPDGFEHLSL
jgi:hypothetical protein